MNQNWMGRYRDLIGALVFYSNASSRCTNTVVATSKSDHISQTEFQILGYICEFADSQKIMADISRDLGILPSIVTKSTKRMHDIGLIEKYHLQGNNKSIILRPTPQGKEIYMQQLKSCLEPSYSAFFDILKDMSDEEIKIFVNAINSLSGNPSYAVDLKDRILSKIE